MYKRQLEGIRHDVERLMKLCHVQENLTTETLDEQIGLKCRYEELLRRYEPVSYTHLDVYKRQDKSRAIELFKQSADNGNAKAAQMLKILSQHLFMK